MTLYAYAARSRRFPEGTNLDFEFSGNDTVALFAHPPSLRPGEMRPKLADLEFQAGPISEYGVNGLTNEILIDILVERIGRLNQMFPCRENSLALTKLEEARHWLDARTNRRVAQGIEGKHEER